MPSFRDGFKIDDEGRPWRAVKTETNLSSNGYTKYTTILWADGTASCDCPGWTRRIKREGPVYPATQPLIFRSCKHTEAIKPRFPWEARQPEPPRQAKPLREAVMRDLRRAGVTPIPGERMDQLLDDVRVTRFEQWQDRKAKDEAARNKPKAPEPTTPPGRASIVWDEDV